MVSFVIAFYWVLTALTVKSASRIVHIKISLPYFILITDYVFILEVIKILSWMNVRDGFMFLGLF